MVQRLRTLYKQLSTWLALQSLFNKRDAAWKLLSAALVVSLIYNAWSLLGNITDRSEVCDSRAVSTAHVSNSSFPFHMALKFPTRYQLLPAGRRLPRAPWHMKTILLCACPGIERDLIGGWLGTS